MIYFYIYVHIRIYTYVYMCTYLYIDIHIIFNSYNFNAHVRWSSPSTSSCWFSPRGFRCQRQPQVLGAAGATVGCRTPTRPRAGCRVEGGPGTDGSLVMLRDVNGGLWWFLLGKSMQILVMFSGIGCCLAKILDFFGFPGFEMCSV